MKDNTIFERDIEAVRLDSSTIQLAVDNDVVNIRYTLDESGDCPQATLNKFDLESLLYCRDDVSIGKGRERGDLEIYLGRVAEGLDRHDSKVDF